MKLDISLLPFFIRVVIAFMFFTVIGTLSHEAGHIAVARYFGYQTTLHYGSMNYSYTNKENDSLYLEYQEIVKKNTQAIKDGKDFQQKDRYLLLVETLKKKYPYPRPNTHWILLGGPAQTLLTSFLGLWILFYRRSKEKEYLGAVDWLAVFLSLFSLREVFNFVMAQFSSVLYGAQNFNGDEFRLSRHLGLNEWVIPGIGFLIGMSIALYVIFKVIPKRYQVLFIISGCIGGVSGFLLWFNFFGKLLLP